MTLPTAIRLIVTWSWSGSPSYHKGDLMEIINLGATDGLPPVGWANVLEKLDIGSSPAPDAHNARTTWLTTLNEDGSPHVTAVGALWLDGSFWFQPDRPPGSAATFPVTLAAR